MKKLIALLTFAGVCLLNFSQAQTTGKQPDAATLSFISQATIGGIKEVKSGELAVQKAQNANVKAFGQRMITDHTKANAQLTQLVQSKGYQITPPTSKETAVDAILLNSTVTFDKDYVGMMVMDHQKTVDLFKDQALNGTDPDIKAFAANTLPVLQQHLDAIKALAAKLNVNTNTM